MFKLLSSITLSEGITHIEDLSNSEFIRTIETMKEKIVTEKLDGANLWFGLDDVGLFTSREGKSPKRSRFYKVSDYPSGANNNGFRAAHLAIKKAEDIIRKHLDAGDMVEIEVLAGRQPNTVTYGVEGKNFIVILRGVNGTKESKVDSLSSALNKKKFVVKSTVVTSNDGDKLESSEQEMTWEFTNVVPLAPKKIDTSKVNDMLEAMKAYLKSKNEALPDMTNGEVSELSLTGIPKDQRDVAKEQRELISQEIMTKFKLPIKEYLLTGLVRKIKPMLQDKDLHPSEDIGVEGIVVRDPVTGSMTKIVDKDIFTAINTFNSSVRNRVSGLVRTTKSDAPTESRGGVFGEAKIRIAELLGAPDLAMSSGVKRFISKYKKEDIESTALALSRHLNISSLAPVRTKIAAILENSLNEIEEILSEFKKDADKYTLTLKTGKDIGISPEIMKRTLTAFAETKQDIRDIRQRVLKARNSGELILALYGRTIESLFEGISEMKKHETSLLRTFVMEDDGGGEAGGEAAGTTTSANVIGATTAKAIAPTEIKLFGNRMITRRKRNWAKPKKFPAPKKDDANRTKYSLLRGVHEGTLDESWTTVKNMQFATDVDDSASAINDIEFKQLRNNVSMNGNVSQSDVNKYLSKAHDLNDEVDTVTFGMELDNGMVVKVYVAAPDADEFEKSMAAMLGKYDDVEEVINIAAEKYDIVDVEWPEGIEHEDNVQSSDEPSGELEGDQSADEGDEESESHIDNFEIQLDDEEELEDTDNEEESENTDKAEGEAEESEDTDKAEGEAEESEDTDKAEEADEDEDKEADEDEERDEFGQLKKKKKKEKTEESVSASGTLLTEADQKFTNQGVELVVELLEMLGIDVNSPRSVMLQMKKLRSTPQMMALRGGATLQRLRLAFAQVKKVLDASKLIAPEQKPDAVINQESFSLINSIITEERVKWQFADLQDVGFNISTAGMVIKMTADEAEKLQLALDNKVKVSVLSQNGKRFIFNPIDDEYEVYETGKPSSAKILDAEYLEILSNKLLER